MHSVSKSPPPPPPSRITPCYGTIIMGSPVHVNEPHKTNTVSHRYMYMYIQCTCSGGAVHHKVVRSRHQLILAWQWQFKCLMHNEIVANSFVKVQKVLIVWTAVRSAHAQDLKRLLFDSSVLKPIFWPDPGGGSFPVAV